MLMSVTTDCWFVRATFLQIYCDFILI